MLAKTPVSEQRRRRAGGNTLIESVFTVLPTFALIFAFVDFGLVIFRWSTLQNAVREGCRYAITFQTANGQGQNNSVRAVVSQFSMGMVNVTDNPQKIYVKYYNISDLSPGNNVPGNIVEVSVQGISWAWLAPLSGAITWQGSQTIRTDAPIGLNVYSSDILGAYPPGTPATGVPQ